MSDIRFRRLRCKVRVRHAREGQVLILFALMVFTIVGFIALSVDGGFVLAERRQVQSAADAGALAAAIDKLAGSSAATQIAAGKAYGAENAGTTLDMVAVDPNPAGYGPNYVRVTVTKDVDKFFIGAVYTGDWRVEASAVAGIEHDAKPYALLVLNNPLDLRGTVSLVINDGSVHVNDDITRSGASNTVRVDGTISATGSVNELSSWQYGDLRENTSYTVEDPLAGTPPPPPGTTITSSMLSSAGFSVSGSKWVCSTTCTLPPGYYHHTNLGRNIIEAGGTVNLGKGIFTFDGNVRLTMGNTNSWINGNGVLLYFKGSARFEPGNGNFHLVAPCLSTTTMIGTCSGEAAYAGGANGMTLWIANCTDFDASGNGNYTFEGVVYAPCSFVSMDGTPGTQGMQVIVGELQIRGTGTFEITYRSYVEASTPKIYLVE
jgi:Flp pilus assembly protein TadG